MHRQPKRRWPVIAAAVALLLLASPSVVAASASDRADFAQAVASGGGPSAHMADAKTISLLEDLIKKSDTNQKLLVGGLKANALKVVGGGLAQGVAFAAVSWVLEKYGLGGGGIDDQIAALGSQLSEIQDTLNKIDQAVGQLQTDLARTHFSNLVAQAATIVSAVNTETKDLNAIAHLPSADLTRRKERTNILLERIKDDLFGKQTELADRVGGTAGADGVIAAAYKDVLARNRLWTLHSSLQVRAVAAYYEAAETRLLMLRLEYMHAKPSLYDEKDIEGAISQFDADLWKQNSQLKPDPGANVIADRDTHLEWLGYGLRFDFTHEEATQYATRVGSTGQTLQGIYSNGRLTGFRTIELGKGWRLPLTTEVLAFIKGWSGQSGWISWVNGTTGVHWGTAADGVWSGESVGRFTTGVNTAGASVVSPIFPIQRRSPFLVRTRSHNYW